jgi:hypothetical protein
MKKAIIIAALIPLLVGCTEKSILHANLRSVTDRKEIREDDMGNDINIRSLYVCYNVTNNSNDSIFIPIGYPYEDALAISIKSRDSLKTFLFLERCNKFKPSVLQQNFAPGERFLISFRLQIYPKNGNDKEWLEKASTKELMSKLELKLVVPAEIKDADKIPDIVFNNDTDDICINPVIKARNINEKAK